MTWGFTTDTDLRSAPTPPQHILVVDDEADLRDAIKRMFEDVLKDVKVLSAPSGKAALEILRTSRVDLIITDYKMPEMDGLEFLSKARAEAPKATRVLVTAFPDVELAIRAVNEAGIETFFTKPFVPAQVIGVVRSLLADRREEEEKTRSYASSFEALRKKASDQRKQG